MARTAHRIGLEECLLSESNTDSPLPGGGRRIARAPGPVTPAEATPEAPDTTPMPPAPPATMPGRRRAAGPPRTVPPETGGETGGRRRARTAPAEPAPPVSPAASAPATVPPRQAPPVQAPTAPTTRGHAAPAPAPAAPRVVDATMAPEAAAAVGAPTTTATTARPVVEEPPLFRDEPPRTPTAWDRPLVTTSTAVTDLVADELPEPEPVVVPVDAPLEPRQSRVIWTLCIVTLLASVVAGGQLADREGWFSPPDLMARIAALVASWGAIVLLARRCGGRYVIIGGFSALVLTLVGLFPEEWALAGAAVSGAAAFGVLGMVLTRPAQGPRVLRELVVSAFIGLCGAVVVSGYDVELRPYRFRVMVLALVLVGAFALAWQLGHGARSLGRRGLALIVFGVVALAGSVAYVQAIRSWGSPDVVQTLTDLNDWIKELLGAAPRPVEAIVGFPALVWGVWVRNRRRQGWWMSAFGALGAAGVTSSLIAPGSLANSLQATGYGVLIGGLLGLVLILFDRLLTKGGGRRADSSADVDRPEPRRFAPLL